MDAGRARDGGAIMLSACGPTKPERVLSQPSAPAHTGAPLPLGQVDWPVNLAKFDSDPCSLLTRDQAAAVVVDPPNNIRAYRQTALPALGCGWTNPGGAFIDALKPIQYPTTLTELSTSPLKMDGKPDPWTETSIAGLPAIVYHVFRNVAECSVSV
ncbi:MAG TPA: DUF3558 family protein [Amycolatopsis sp.]|nr:DUF3558 family protein [Amycolatopsis sp.]